jgi:UPF0042 nucleotide-binding protein
MTDSASSAAPAPASLDVPGSESPEPPTRARVVVVTGLSGAGKTTALAALEDRGYHTIENLPPSVMDRAIEACESSGITDVALGIGASVAAFLDGAVEALARLESRPGRKLDVLFLEASDEILVRRFSETRRPHPLVAAALREKGRSGAEVADVVDGVRRERDLLAPLRARAEVVIDTSALRVHDLRKRVIEGLRPASGRESTLSARLLTFGFKYGLPSDADVVFDVRFLDNPYFVPELRELTGLDAAVREHVLASADARSFVEQAASMLEFLVPRYEAEGKSYLTIAVGCTGGQHRSVSIAIALAERLSERPSLRNIPLRVVHRDALSGPRSSRAADGGRGEALGDRVDPGAGESRVEGGACLRGGAAR